MLEHAESWSYTFEEVGEYDYLCTPHPYMKGKVIVWDGSDSETIPAAVASAAAGFLCACSSTVQCKVGTFLDAVWSYRTIDNERWTAVRTLASFERRAAGGPPSRAEAGNRLE